MSRHQRNVSSVTTVPITSFFNFIIITFIITNISCVHSINELCPGRCKCEDEYLRAACVFASLEVVPIQLNPEIQHLDLSNNRIGSLTLAFGFYDNLQSLDMSSNVIHTLGSENFLLQKHLINLNISNNKIKTISKSALIGLESLNTLDLSNNNISDMDPQTFRYTNELEYVDLSGNSLMSLPDGLLKNLPKIKILKLRHNSLLQVPKLNLELAPSLQLLDLSDNLILEIGRDSIPFLRSLVTLNLANNVIRSISDGAFERLPALLYLNIEGNNLTVIPTDALSRLSVLSHLILSHNPLTTLNSLAFRNLFELKILDLRQCELTMINQRAFADNINLEEVLFDGNHQLQYLPSRVLYNARYLKTVSLRYCKLSTLEPTHFPVDDLKTLRVGGNPFVCNCSLHWLWNVIHTEEQRNKTKLWVDSDEIICNDPEFNGKLLNSLMESSLRCRLSTLYLSILAAGCLAATATILGLIAWITRVKRRKRLPFAPPNRPELLVYVGQSPRAPEKNLLNERYSGNRRLIEQNHDGLYDLPRQNDNKNIGMINNFNYQMNSNSNGLYEMPQDCCRSASSSFLGSIDDSKVFHDELGDKKNCRSNIEGIYAVTDVTGMLRDNRGVKQYRMNDNLNSKQQNRTPFSSGSNSEYDLDYEYGYRNAATSNERPHVAFV
ncbi:hypothetical protein PV326_004623 [Microctonus aethiopoides]|nr:hypothetical protein PV326_004623 [Microctonus aethiopoides]